MIFFIGGFEESQFDVDVIPKDVSFAEIVVEGVGDVATGACNADDHWVLSHWFGLEDYKIL